MQGLPVFRIVLLINSNTAAFTRSKAANITPTLPSRDTLLDLALDLPTDLLRYPLDLINLAALMRQSILKQLPDLILQASYHLITALSNHRLSSS
jgi:hypothetical protein